MYYNPVEVIETANWLDECRNAQNKLGLQNPIIITSSGNLIRQKLKTVFNSNSIFSKIESNPTFNSSQKAIIFSQEQEFDGVIAIGGGSTMDTAKTVMAALGTGIHIVEELLETTFPFGHRVPSIFVPTTHGTGSEVTMWGTIWDKKEKKKYSISHVELYPNIAILDGSLTQSMPLDLSLITTMDALSHSFEAIWNKNANSVSTEYATEAICLILNNVKKLRNGLDNIEVRNVLLRASCIAGQAFSNTKSAAAHSISYPLTANFGIPHGIASSISLIPLLDINASRINKALTSILRRLQMTGLNDLKEEIKKLQYSVLKYSLRDWGVKANQLNWLVSQSFTRGRIENNIIDLSRKDIHHILESVF
jgi:alcohol dehydrogenase class IV